MTGHPPEPAASATGRRPRWLAPLLLTLCVLSSGCLLRPTNGIVVPDIESPVEFVGRSGIANASVRILAAPSPSGPFEFVTDIRTGANSSFASRAIIPEELWARACPSSGFRTYVRAQNPDGTALLTFDDASVAGRSPEQCLREERADGGIVGALRACVSPDSPLAEVTTEGLMLATEIDGDVIISDPALADDLVCVERIFGSLVIDDLMVQDIALPALREVTGDVTIVYQRGTAETTPAEIVDLPVLRSIGGDLDLRVPAPAFGGSAVSVDFGMPALVGLGGDLLIDIDAFNSGAGGLTALPNIAGNLVYRGATSDANGGGLLTSLTTIGGDLSVTLGSSTGGTTQNFFDALTDVGGHVAISGGLWVGGANFNALATVGGDMRISDISVFPDPPRSGPNTFGALTAVAGTLDVDALRHPLEDVGSAAVSLGGVRLNANSWLTDLAVSLAKYLIDPAGPITITDNINLRQCDAVAYVAALPGHVGPVTISGNQLCN